MRNVILQQYVDMTVTICVGEDLYLRRLTPNSEQQVTPNPFYWGNWTRATEELLAYVNCERDLKDEIVNTTPKEDMERIEYERAKKVTDAYEQKHSHG